jgi:prepilin-type N-terminal cleavage/methylation domain-containing protein
MNFTLTPARLRRGFTLVELLVVIAIIGTLVGLLLPAVQVAREAARRSHCTNNIKQLGLAMHNYLDVNRTFPFGAQYSHGNHHSWILDVLPFIEQQSISNQFPKSIFTIAQVPAAKVAIPTLQCPSDTYAGRGLLIPGQSAGSDWWWDQGMGYTCYRSCNGAMWSGAPYWRADATGRFGSTTSRDMEWGNGIFPANRYWARTNVVRTRMADITDGTSKTMALGEALISWSDKGCWVDDSATIAVTAIPMNLYKTSSNRVAFASDWRINTGFMSNHPGGAAFGMADGSCNFLSETLDMSVYNALGTISTGEAVTTIP